MKLKRTLRLTTTAAVLVPTIFMYMLLSCLTFPAQKGGGAPMFIDVMENIEINDVMQCVSICAEKKDAPLLLYLHGGPGDAALPLVLKYNKALEKDFTVVVWEQRGAGKSYYKFAQDEELTIDTFVGDTHELVTHLLEKFSQEKLYLVGHSWGSVIGLKFIQQYPQLIHTYVGCGQVVNMQKSSQMAYDFALTKNIAAGNQKNVDRLNAISPTYENDAWFDDLLFVTKQVVKHKGSLYGKANYNSFVWDFITSDKYSLKDLLNREKGSLQSIQHLWQELMTVNFEDIKSFGVPVIFIEGRFDEHVSSKLAGAYWGTIETEKEFHWFEKSCHFPQWSEAEKFSGIIRGIKAG